MLDFEEELKNFKPSLEISAVEDSIVKSDISDLNDIMMELFRKQIREQS
ncbi:MAG: hypothetical protein Q4A19_05575 [Johnsonella sp.]|nr:hypothetical protein [Johnsonella sp.]